MTEKLNQDNDFRDSLEADALWDLLQKNASAHPVEPSPWFAARTVALATSGRVQESSFSLLRKWLFSIPIAGAGVACAVMLTLHFAPLSTKQNSFVSSEEEFEQHMELFYASLE